MTTTFPKPRRVGSLGDKKTGKPKGGHLGDEKPGIPRGTLGSVKPRGESLGDKNCRNPTGDSWVTKGTKPW